MQIILERNLNGNFLVDDKRHLEPSKIILGKTDFSDKLAGKVLN